MRWRIARRDLGSPQRNEMISLIRITPQLRAILAPHVALQLVNRRRLWPAHDVESDGLIGVATETSDFEVMVTRIEGITQRGRRLRRSLEGEHPLIPRLAGEPVGFRADFLRPLCRCLDRAAVNGLA